MIIFAIDCIALTAIVLMQEGKSAGDVYKRQGIFFHDHGNDIRSPAGRADIKEHGRAKGRKRDGKSQFQHRLIGKRLVQWIQPFQYG